MLFLFVLCSLPIDGKTQGTESGWVKREMFSIRSSAEFCSIHKDFQINNKVKATRELVLKQRRATGIEPRALFEEIFQ